MALGLHGVDGDGGFVGVGAFEEKLPDRFVFVGLTGLEGVLAAAAYDFVASPDVEVCALGRGLGRLCGRWTRCWLWQCWCCVQCRLGRCGAMRWGWRAGMGGRGGWSGVYVWVWLRCRVAVVWQQVGGRVWGR